MYLLIIHLKSKVLFPSMQIEYYISAEESLPNASGLYSFSVSTLSVDSYEEVSISFYPNPAKHSITLSQSDCITKIYAITGQLVKASTNKHIDVSDLTTGIYLVKIKGKNNENSASKRLIIQ